MKRAMDLSFSVVAIAIVAPVVAISAIAIWLQDRRSPLYVAERVGRNARTFRMVKLRSMVHGADRSGVDSTAAGDPRITRVGRFIRRGKLDELPQLWNVLRGEMSLVGPRPNVAREVALYTNEEKKLLSVRPGITDIASIVFADESDVLAGARDADLAYNQLIRPWKSRLGLLYVENRTVGADLRILGLTAMNAVVRRRALPAVGRIVMAWSADPDLARVAQRVSPLQPSAPPGADAIVESRQA